MSQRLSSIDIICLKIVPVIYFQNKSLANKSGDKERVWETSEYKLDQTGPRNKFWSKKVRSFIGFRKTIANRTRLSLHQTLPETFVYNKLVRNRQLNIHERDNPTENTTLFDLKPDVYFAFRAREKEIGKTSERTFDFKLPLSILEQRRAWVQLMISRSDRILADNNFHVLCYAIMLCCVTLPQAAINNMPVERALY